MKNTMQVFIKTTTAVCVCLTVVFAVMLLINGDGIWKTLVLTFGTASYHFCMRLIVGAVVNRAFEHGADYNNKWFREKNFERGMYKFLRVKEWKGNMPTYIPEDFSTNRTSLEGIVNNMCVAEVGHEIIGVLGFVTLLFSLFTDNVMLYFWVFFVTAFVSGLLDLMSVVIQRFNRPRVVKLIKMKKYKKKC